VNNEIDPITIDTGNLGLYCGDGEIYEGMLVRFENVTVESVNDYDDVYINDGSGSTKIGDYFFDNDYGDFPAYCEGDVIDDIVGTVIYAYGEYIVYPKSMNDLSDGGSGGVCGCDFDGGDDGGNLCESNGDANDDGNINVVDVVNIVGYVLGNQEFTDEQLCASDLNGDEVVNVVDIVNLVNIILGGD
jgi:hypothetical protein